MVMPLLCDFQMISERFLKGQRRKNLRETGRHITNWKKIGESPPGFWIISVSCESVKCKYGTSVFVVGIMCDLCSLNQGDAAVSALKQGRRSFAWQQLQQSFHLHSLTFL